MDYFFNPITIVTVSLGVAIFACVYYLCIRKPSRERHFGRYELKRKGENPVMSPRLQYEWEANGTFNPAAVSDEEGQIHIFYRALGSDGLSRIGHAAADPSGRYCKDRSTYPVFQPSPGHGLRDPRQKDEPMRYDTAIYTSGGGWGGCEDPRAVRIGDRVYMSYVAFEGWGSVRIGLTSISTDDLKHKRWRWRRPALISPKNEVHKNWVIFPEKIGGKFAVLQGISPNIRMQYVDSLDNFPTAKSMSGSKPMGERAHAGRKGFWDNWTRGAGPPPLKTDKGWLLLYQAMDAKDPNRYKVGAMILDLADPSKILYRSPQPILSPDMYYENDGKPGVVYASGAVIKDGNLLVYYGGGDRHVCLAETPLQPLLDWLVKYGKVS